MHCIDLFSCNCKCVYNKLTLLYFILLYVLDAKQRFQTDLITLVTRGIDGVVRLNTINDQRQLFVIVFLSHRHVHVVQKLLHVLDLRTTYTS